MVEKRNIRAEVGEETAATGGTTGGATGATTAGATASPRELVENLRELINEAEKMIVETASAQMDETVAELREQLEMKLDHLRANYRDAEERLLTTAAAADQSIRQKPYQAMGIAAGVGILIGMWMSRRN